MPSAIAPAPAPSPSRSDRKPAIPVTKREDLAALWVRGVDQLASNRRPIYRWNVYRRVLKGLTMADEQQLAMARHGSDAWNAWRNQNRDVRVDLIQANLSGANLSGADLSEAELISAGFTGGANLSGANLSRANLIMAILSRADLSGADLSGANLSQTFLYKAQLVRANLSEASGDRTNFLEADLSEADLSRGRFDEANLSEAHLVRANLVGANLSRVNVRMANLSGANLSKAGLSDADLSWANLSRANLSRSHLVGANLSGANLSGADLSEADLTSVDFTRANLSGANLSRAGLTMANLVGTKLWHADLTGCRVYGISAWDLKLVGAKQKDLIITPPGEPEITVDNLEVAQFIYLVLHNEKIRDIIDTIGKKGVLLLGRFTDGRVAILERLREELRSRGWVPMVFNFDKPETKDFTETVRLLAGLSRFVIVDITNPRSTPLELQATVPEYMIPFVPILERGEKPFSMFEGLWIKHREWVLEPIRYSSVDALVRGLDAAIVGPALTRSAELMARKAEQYRISDIEDIPAGAAPGGTPGL